MNIKNYMAVTENTEGILGKMVYYSVSNVLIHKAKFCEIGTQFGLAKVKPARESATDAFRNATSDIYDRITLSRNTYGKRQILRIYCRDNRREDNDRITGSLSRKFWAPPPTSI